MDSEQRPTIFEVSPTFGCRCRQALQQNLFSFFPETLVLFVGNDKGDLEQLRNRRRNQLHKIVRTTFWSGVVIKFRDNRPISGTTTYHFPHF